MCFWFSSSSHYIYIHVKMKLAIAALLAGSAAAFAPAQTGRVATDLAVSELELGVTEPLGVYDPLRWNCPDPRLLRPCRARLDARLQVRRRLRRRTSALTSRTPRRRPASSMSSSIT